MIGCRSRYHLHEACNAWRFFHPKAVEMVRGKQGVGAVHNLAIPLSSEHLDDAVFHSRHSRISSSCLESSQTMRPPNLNQTLEP